MNDVRRGRSGINNANPGCISVSISASRKIQKCLKLMKHWIYLY